MLYFFHNFHSISYIPWLSFHHFLRLASICILFTLSLLFSSPTQDMLTVWLFSPLLLSFLFSFLLILVYFSWLFALFHFLHSSFSIWHFNFSNDFPSVAFIPLTPPIWVEMTSHKAGYMSSCLRCFITS